MSETNENKFPRLTEKDRGEFSDPVGAAKWLLGKVICRKISDKDVLRLYITETEAYDYKDKACYGYDPQVGYAHIGKRTDANAPLFEKQAGTGCVFGGMLLISCGEIGKPSNVFIRTAGNEQVYFNGPFKIYDGLQLKNFRSVDLLTSDDLWLEYPAEEKRCCQTTRVGPPESAGKQSREAKHRFIIL